MYITEIIRFASCNVVSHNLIAKLHYELAQKNEDTERGNTLTMSAQAGSVVKYIKYITAITKLADCNVEFLTTS